MKQLSQSEFLATFREPMRRLSRDEEPPFEFWSYFESIPAAHFEGHDCSAGTVTYAWEDASGRFQHVLVNTEDKNVFMVLVLDISSGDVLGHRLLDHNREYGLTRHQ
jgi:hypothetical protein